MKTIFMKATNLLFILICYLYPLLINCSCNSNRSTGKPDSTDIKSFENIVVHGSGMDSLKLAEIPGKMQQFVNEKQIAGVVTLVAHNGRITSFEAVGLQNIEKNIRMQKNTLFRIASMTKPFTAAAIMILSDEGKLQLEDPVKKYLPEFRDMWIVSERTGEKAVLTRPSRDITIRDILTHMSGFASLPQDIPLHSIAEYVLVISQRPLQSEPGSKYSYSGPGITTAARIVEVLSGQPFDVFLTERIFKPLGMNDTHFYLPEEDQDRIASIYIPSADSGLKEINYGVSMFDNPVNSINHPGWYSFPRPEGGLYSTAIDHAKWLQTILNKGIFDGHRILSEESVMEMTKIQTDEFTSGMSYGLGFRVVSNPTGVTSMLSRGTFGHGGAFGTQGWADPGTNTLFIVMIQRQGFPGGDSHDIRHSLQQIATSAILK